MPRRRQSMWRPRRPWCTRRAITAGTATVTGTAGAGMGGMNGVAGIAITGTIITGITTIATMGATAATGTATECGVVVNGMGALYRAFLLPDAADCVGI